VSRAVASIAVDRSDGPAAELVAISVPAELPAVLADGGLLERVVANLIENALRYNPPGLPVQVAAEARDEVVELRVVDHGPGIAAADREAVFAAFQRRDDRAVSTGAGVGLGLAIARGFVEAMQGRIALETTPGGGLMVLVDLPVAHGPGVSTGAEGGSS
jgi:two-component system sensor histidine kinase KdpD